MRARQRELVIGAAGALLVGASIVADGGGPVSIVAGTVAGAALGGLHRHTRAAWLAVALATAAMAIETDGDLPGGMTILIPVVALGAGLWETRWGGVAAVVGLIGAWEFLDAMTPDSAFVPALLIPATAWAAGRALRERERVARQLAARARELEEEREAYAALSVRYERARIASELHDIVAHAISVMVVQASAGQRLTHDPEATAETFEAIAGAARQAEQDMGRLVALLGDEKAIGPAPDLALVEELVARAAGSGLDVTLRLEGEREGLPAEVGETAYRIVQEGLTNALRYAAGAAVSVRVRAGRDELVVAVENDTADNQTALAGAGTGNGLRGLRERVDACGGRLEAGTTANGGWLLAARLPRRIKAAAGHPTG
jgi:signal transduction histidine kinase